MDVEEAIRTRRTHKVYGSEHVDRAVLTELLELGRWAPNHHLTNPWRFRVLGPESLERLKAAVGADGAGKLDRAPTLVAVSYLRTPDDPVAEEEDLLAVGCAAYAVLLGAHNRGLAGYWRTPAILREPAGRAALDIPDAERCIGLLHLGPARQEQHVPERAPLDEVVTFLA
ncbi:MAG TPA: nitroreductase [Baekduia sp.]|nr:nitroreductase [Baekduia sp.]